MSHEASESEGFAMKRLEGFAVKRLLVLAVLSVTAVFLVTSVAVGQSGTAASSTSSKVTPKRDKKRPYKFKTTGSVRFPREFCAPNAPARNCIPLRCPAGVRDARYCARPTAAQVCSGRIKVVFKKGRSTRSSKTVRLKANCKYSSTATIRKKARLKVSVRFSGNTILAPSKASTKSVRAG